MFSFLKSLRFRLVFLVLLSALPALGLTLYTGLEERQAAASRAQNDALRVAHLALNQQEALIEGAKQLLTVLAHIPEVQAAEPDSCSKFLSNLLDLYQNYGTLGLVDLNGNLVCQSSAIDFPINIADRPYFLEMVQSGRFVAGDFVFSRFDGNTVLPFVYPVKSETGEVKSAVLATLEFDWFEPFFSETNLPVGSVFLVVDPDGTILSRYPHAKEWVGRTIPDMQEIRTVIGSNGQRTITTAGADGVRRLYAFSFLDIGQKGAYIGYGIPTNLAFANITRSLIVSLVTLSVITLFGLLAAWMIADVFILRKVNKLVAVTQRLAQGDLIARTGQINDGGELSQLANAFDQMAEALQERDGQLRQTEAKYRTLVEQIPAITYISSLDTFGKTLYISPQVESILGISAEEWLAEEGAWATHLHPDDRVRVLAEFSETRTEGKTFRSEYRLLDGNGQMHWIQDASTLVTGQDGKPLFLQGIMVNITGLKQAEAELKSYAVQLERSNRELQDFANIASHDLQEPLRKIQAFGERLQGKYSRAFDEGGRDYLDRMISSAFRMQILINDLLSYSRITSKAHPFVEVNLNQVLREVTSNLQDDLSSTRGCVEVGELPIIYADRVQMQQLFQQLMTNSLKFFRPEETPHLKVFCEPNQDLSNEDNPTITIHFNDNGIGFNEKYLDRIFLPFQRLHGRMVYEGSGIGLAICRKIVERHNGCITATSKPGEGSTFTVTLPIRQKEQENGEH